MTDRSISGFLFAPRSAKGIEARIVGDGAAYSLVTSEGTTPFDLHAVKISARVGRIPRRIEFADGRTFETQDNDGVDALFPSDPRGTVALWLSRIEQFRGQLIAVVVVLVGLGFVTFHWGLPAFADVAAQLMPAKVEAQIGRDTLKTLDIVVLKPSEIAPGRQQEIAAILTSLAAAANKGNSGGPNYVLVFRKGGNLGPNAFALPGGMVIVTDELIALAPSDDAIAGVLAHEMGHVIGHHPMKRIAYGTGLSIIALLVGGTGVNGHEAVVQMSTGLLNSAYSREFEREADSRAGNILALAGRDPVALAAMLEALAKTCGNHCETLPWLSSHPGIAERVHAIRERNKTAH